MPETYSRQDILYGILSLASNHPLSYCELFISENSFLISRHTLWVVALSMAIRATLGSRNSRKLVLRTPIRKA
jgi:hypothetical protein